LEIAAAMPVFRSRGPWASLAGSCDRMVNRGAECAGLRQADLGHAETQSSSGVKKLS
jgi:hypothetical protein